MSNKHRSTPSVPKIALTFEDVFSYPQYTLQGLHSWDEVASLGCANIAALVSKARQHEKDLKGYLCGIRSRQEILKGKSGRDFQEASRKFENPETIEVGILPGNLLKEQEPIDAASKNRKHGATTFNICGWCNHTGGGSCRFNYHITTDCGLISDTSETRFDTSCLLHEKTAEEIKTEVKILEEEAKSISKAREKVRDGIKLLQRLKKDAIEKPYLISLLPHDHFNIGDEVIAYVGQWGEDAKHESLVNNGVWVPANIIFGYRHHDGCVSYESLFPMHGNMSFNEGRGGGVGMSRPELMKISTFSYLQYAVEDDSLFFKIWMSNIDSNLKGFNLDVFIDHLKTGKRATAPEGWELPTEEIPVNTVEEAGNVLHCLNVNYLETEEHVKKWAAMQLRHVHPDHFVGKATNVQVYAERQTRAVYAARDLLIARLKGKK